MREMLRSDEESGAESNLWRELLLRTLDMTNDSELFDAK